MPMLGDYDDERGRDRMDREWWDEAARMPGRKPDESDGQYEVRLVRWLINQELR